MTSFDIEKYRKHVDHFDLSEDQKIDLITTICIAMKNHVERAFGDDPVQLCRHRVIDPKNALKAPLVIDLKATEISRSTNQKQKEEENNE